MNVDEAFDALLDEFSMLPRHKQEPTFLEICKYPRRRFEEICSRILGFYFDPTKEHRLSDLFLSSLLELLKKDIPYRNDDVTVAEEVYADGKRIDLVIYGHSFVIGIENKITAPLYNPLGTYKKKLEEYGKEKTIKIVLSLRPIKGSDEKGLMEKNEFVAITYSEFFAIIKRNIANYVPPGTQYLTHLFDFMATLENMNNAFRMDQGAVNFFYDKSDTIDRLIGAYNEYKNHILSIQKEEIAELKEIISKRTGSEWWVWAGWDLGCSFVDENNRNIGIESWFKETRTNPLGEFRICITAWNLNDWSEYEQLLKKKFSNYKNLEERQNRAFLHLYPIDDPTLIIENLVECFDLLKGIIGGEKAK